MEIEDRKLVIKIRPHWKNDFAEGSKILLDTDLKNNFVGPLKIMSNAKIVIFLIWAFYIIILINKITFLIYVQLKFWIFQQNRSFHAIK